MGALQQRWHSDISPWLDEPCTRGHKGAIGPCDNAATPAAPTPPRALTPDSGESTQDVCPELPASALLALHGLARSPGGRAARRLLQRLDDPGSNTAWMQRALADM